MTTETVTLTAEDGHTLEAYVAHPEGTPKAGLLILQEIFGVNEHIRNVTDSFAAEGYLAIAPAMFDRVKPGLELGYNDFTAARDTMSQLERENCVKDMAAAADYARSAGKVGIVGYCWGGAMADLAACHGIVDAGVSYYGRMTIEWLDLQPECPMLYHYGDRDQLISWETIEKISRKRDGEIRIWGNADHGFSCDARPQFHKAAAQQAREITLALFEKNIAA
jgi:carboxymethylenebutenolidase